MTYITTTESLILFVSPHHGICGLCHGGKVFIYPFSWFLWHNIGIIYAENGQLNEAIAEFEEVLRHEPHNEKARNNLEIIKEELASKPSDKNL